MTELNVGQRQARNWYEGLDKITPAEAEEMLATGENIPVKHGTVNATMSRETALSLLSKHARKAPAEQAASFNWFQLVTIASDGFPVQLRTKPEFDPAAKS